MDIREYNTKDLPYNFVLFYDLPEAELRKYSMDDLPYVEGENSILTYCYIDRQAGLSYRFICKCKFNNGCIEYGKRSETAVMIIREGGLVGQALLLPDGEDLGDLHEIANEIKEGYGYHIDLIKTLEAKRFSNRRHVCYPDDVMVVLFEMGNVKPEQIWVTEIDESKYPDKIKALIGTKIAYNTREGVETMLFAGAGKLINQPFNSAFGYNNGDIVPIYALQGDKGELPIVPASRLVP